MSDNTKKYKPGEVIGGSVDTLITFTGTVKVGGSEYRVIRESYEDHRPDRPQDKLFLIGPRGGEYELKATSYYPGAYRAVSIKGNRHFIKDSKEVFFIVLGDIIETTSTAEIHAIRKEARKVMNK